jgi:hypothetical protein
MNESGPGKEAKRYASDSIELSTRHNFEWFLTAGTIVSGWGRSTSGDTAEGIARIERGLRGFRALGGRCFCHIACH